MFFPVFCTHCEGLSNSSAKRKLNLTHFSPGTGKTFFFGAKIANAACTIYTKTNANFLHPSPKAIGHHFTFSLLFRAAPAHFPDSLNSAAVSASIFADPFFSGGRRGAPFSKPPFQARQTQRSRLAKFQNPCQISKPLPNFKTLAECSK